VTNARFSTTRWTLVGDSASSDLDLRSRALEELCGAYWAPLYSYLRRRGRSPGRAADLVQGLFHGLLARDGIGTVERAGGRFRSWLLTSLQNHERDERDRDGAAKRGGGAPVLSIDMDEGERRYQLVAADDADPDVVFERAWAREVLDQAREALCEESIGRGQGDLFRTLEGTLDGDVDQAERAGLAERLGRSPVAVRVAIHRLRQRYREHILRLVRETLGEEEDAGDELEALLTAVSRKSGDRS